MKKCKSCQTEIDIKAKKCPHCQTDQRNWFLKHKILTVILVLVLIGVFSNSGSNKTNNNSAKTNNSNSIEAIPTVIIDDKPNETMSQKNAVRKAKSYIEMTGFSRNGLIKQLEYEQFSNEDAIYGVDNISVDWNKQAEIKAKSYIDMTAFSKGSLIKQLEYDGFTNEQAVHGVSAIGL